jgi:hypothetical protein
VAGIRGRARDGCVGTIGGVRIRCIFELTKIHGASVVVITSGVLSSNGANRRAKIGGGG